MKLNTEPGQIPAYQGSWRRNPLAWTAWRRHL